MNPIFSPSGEGWPDFPAVSYGRIDQTEPVDPSSATEAVFAFDAVDASWLAFAANATFDLGDAQRLRIQQENYWRRLFGHSASRPSFDPYDKAPIFRIEITSRPGDLFFDRLMAFKEVDWVRIELAPSGTFEVDVYGGLFAAPVFAHLRDISREITFAAALSYAFDMLTWPDSTTSAIKSALGGVGKLDFIVAFDVGQGSAVGLTDATETPQLFFDLGCGVYRNRHTRPVPLRFCWRGDPPVVLSHWDSDHWAGETSDPAAASRIWIAPRQTISPKHSAFASRILSAGGTIHIWGAAPSTLSFTLAPRQQLTLARCTGPTSNRNACGIAGMIENGPAPQAWLLTGDAGYHQLGLTPPSDVTAVVVPHHGADMGLTSVPPLRPAGYARLLYSFGPGNAHGRTAIRHPTSGAVRVHTGQGWNHGAWPTGPGSAHAGGDILATATHPSAHLDGAAASWSSAPAVPFSSIPCAVGAPSAGCTAAVAQA